MFSHFSTVLTCDGQTDGQTDTAPQHTIVWQNMVKLSASV